MSSGAYVYMIRIVADVCGHIGVFIKVPGPNCDSSLFF
jgi:hypothetical protein